MTPTPHDPGNDHAGVVFSRAGCPSQPAASCECLARRTETNAEDGILVEVFFTADHYNGYASVIVRLDAIDEDSLQEIVEDAWTDAPLSTKLDRFV